MSEGLVAIVIATVSLGGTGLAAWLSSRAQQTGAKVQEKAALFEGYDEFVSHLRARILELEERLEAMISRAHEAAAECEECRDLLRGAKEDYQALRLVLELLRRELGFPPGWDPFEHLEEATGIRPYGRRTGDAVIPPPGWPGREHWTGSADRREPEEGDPNP